MPLKTVAIAYPASVPWMAECLQGIRDYANEIGGWRLLTSPPTLTGSAELAVSIRSLRDWGGDGIIANIVDSEELRLTRRLKIPVVNIGGVLSPRRGPPRVMVNHFRIGELGAKHFLDRGLKQVAFYGLRGLWFSQERERGFRSVAKSSSVVCETFSPDPEQNPNATLRQRLKSLAAWVEALPKPVGIMAVQDYRARALVDVCLDLGLIIPNHVAILGVDNDPTICEFCTPTLSSISRNSRIVGYEAARLLDRLMKGRPVTSEDQWIEPAGVVARQSTDRLFISDPSVLQAVHFMEEHLSNIFNIKEMVDSLGVSRRSLEQKFLIHLNASPGEYLGRLRVKRAEELLLHRKKMTLHEVARECGFSQVKSLRSIFFRVTGTKPLAYRQAKIKAG